MIYSPVRITVENEGKRAKVVTGVLLEAKDIAAVTKLISKVNANGLKGKDAVLLMKLYAAASSTLSMHCGCSCKKSVKKAQTRKRQKKSE